MILFGTFKKEAVNLNPCNQICLFPWYVLLLFVNLQVALILERFVNHSELHVILLS